MAKLSETSDGTAILKYPDQVRPSYGLKSFNRDPEESAGVGHRNSGRHHRQTPAGSALWLASANTVPRSPPEVADDTSKHFKLFHGNFLWVAVKRVCALGRG